jgi:arylsulfatase A-like enzyme
VYQRAELRLNAEIAMYAQAREWLRHRPSGDPPFLLVLRTLLGHQPLFDPRRPAVLSASDSSAVAEARRGIAVVQDSLIGVIVDQLEAARLLASTVIVIVADHGVRFRDSRLRSGPSPVLSFRVPLIVFAPQVEGPLMIEHPTSHADLVPTVLALVDQPHSHPLYQGVPIWKATADRTVFLLAEGFLGYDAVARGKSCYVWNYLSGVGQLRDPCESEGGGTPASAATEAARELDGKLRAFRDLQFWTRSHLLHSTGRGQD